MNTIRRTKEPLSITNPELIKEWDYTKNVFISPNEVTNGSNRKVYWKCSEGHEWYARICDRCRGSGCPVCSQHVTNEKIIQYHLDLIGSLQDNNPDLANEWNYAKNRKLKPSVVTPFSNKKVWWVCSKGHEWEDTIESRSNGTGCPKCSIKRKMEPLSVTHPELAKEWNYEKNDPLTPKEVTKGSHKIVWWRCSKGHIWDASIHDRTGKDNNCPICSNHRIIVGVNDLATTNPELAKEWNYEKNKHYDLTPLSITAGSNKKVWWKCFKGHEWESIVANRLKGVGCPVCSKELRTSFPEQAVYYYFSIFFSDCINGDKKTIAPSELDVYIPSLKTAVEYDGRTWHSTETSEKRDNKKNQDCINNGIRLFRIRENGCSPLIPVEGVSVYTYNYGDTKKLGEIINEILSELIGLKCSIDIDKDRQTIYGLLDAREKQKSIAKVKPELLNEWDYERNEIDPNTISAGTQMKVWWKCSNGHSWLAGIDNRVKGRKCPYCTNRIVMIGFNDLSTTNPDLVKEWNYEKNNAIGLFPDKITRGTSKKAWWKCKLGHEWQATVSSRTGKDAVGCPYCSNGKGRLLPGFNDLETTNPGIAKEWNYEKNSDLLPSMVMKGQHLKLWWKCSNGHEWEDYIFNRVRGRKCPHCPRTMEYKGNNILSKDYPEIANEWNYEKNAPIKPDVVASRSGKKFWWKCSKGHEWEATVADRTNGNRCPFCSGKRVIKGATDLATTNPDLVKEWNYERNEGITPQDVKEHSNKKVWWKCSKGHEWEAVISSRATGCGCPYCSGRLPVVGETDLATINPLLAQDWNYSKNENLKPSDFTASSGKKVWWICQTCGNEWLSSIHGRSAGRGCPYCSNSKVMSGFNDLATLNPVVASEWNYEKNIGMSPTDFSVCSGRRVWWKCTKGHEWESTIANRTSRNSICPICRKLSNSNSS